MGVIKKVGTLENQQALQEAIDRLATAQGNYNSTVKAMTEEQTQEIKEAIEQAVERMSTAQGNYNGTTKAISEDIDEIRSLVTDIYAAVVTKE